MRDRSKQPTMECLRLRCPWCGGGSRDASAEAGVHVCKFCEQRYRANGSDHDAIAANALAPILAQTYARFPNGCPWCETGDGFEDGPQQEWLDPAKGLVCRECGNVPYEQEPATRDGIAAKARAEGHTNALREFADALAFDPEEMTVQAIVDHHRGMMASRPDVAQCERRGADQARAEERAAIVAWLRDYYPIRDPLPKETAALIERGDHHKEPR